jgi:hypothetical protein
MAARRRKTIPAVPVAPLNPMIKPPPWRYSTAIAEPVTIAPFDALGSCRVQARRCAMRYDDDFDDLPCFRAVQ